METLEFVMQTDLATALPAVLEFNYDTLKSALAARMDLYRGLVVTEDGIKAAKQDRADLNKLREAIVSAEGKVASDLEVLSTVESEFAEAVRLKYLEALDLNAALAERARLQERAAKLREYEEQRRRAAEAEAANVPEAERAEAAAKDAGQAEAAPAMGAEETVYLLRFECQLTRSQAAELSAWLKDRNISYRRI